MSTTPRNKSTTRNKNKKRKRINLQELKEEKKNTFVIPEHLDIQKNGLASLHDNAHDDLHTTIVEWHSNADPTDNLEKVPETVINAARNFAIALRKSCQNTDAINKARKEFKFQQTQQAQNPTLAETNRLTSTTTQTNKPIISPKPSTVVVVTKSTR
jgi:hypothetical protein